MVLKAKLKCTLKKRESKKKGQERGDIFFAAEGTNLAVPEVPSRIWSLKKKVPE